MAGRPDIGGYFEQMKDRARGGRRLDGTGADGTQGYEPAPRQTKPPPSRPRTTSSGGGLTEKLKDILGRARAKSTTGSKTQPRRREQLPDEGVVAIEYAPQRDGDPDPGEVVWAWVPFEEDPEQGKDRPIVIIGRRNRELVGVPLTTKRNDREAQISIGTGDWDPKRRESYARIWRMLDVDPSSARREGSALDRRRFDAVVAAVDEYYDVAYPQPASNQRSDDDYDF